jgi:hypothetical protein
VERVCAILEGAALVAVALWTLRHIEDSTSFAEGMAGVLIAVLVLWGIAWGIPEGLSMFDRSIERRKKVFERPH